jgi:hypothetical protein
VNIVDFFVYLNKNRTLKSAEIVFMKRRRDEGK